MSATIILGGTFDSGDALQIVNRDSGPGILLNVWENGGQTTVLFLTAQDARDLGLALVAASDSDIATHGVTA